MKFGYTCLLSCLTAFAVTVTALPSLGQTPPPYTDSQIAKVESLFKAGNDLMEQKKFADALTKYKEGLVIAPDSQGLLYNGGLAAFSVNDFTLALDLWKRAKTGDLDDMQVRAKLIQTYQALGRSAERDAERKELYAIRNSGRGKELFDTDYYVREQTVIAGKQIMVFEYFELKGDRAVRYIFYILDDKGKIGDRISLGSYEFDNNMWHEMTKPTPKPQERLFHLDGYYSWGHATYGMYPRELTYDETREMVKNILEKNLKPAASSTVVNQKP
jgi:tetratricopeptide (TPR) repeat protein